MAASNPVVSEEDSEISEEFEKSPPEDLLSIGSLSKGPVFASVLEDNIMDSCDSDVEEPKTVPHCTPEVKTLVISAALFSSITSVQIYSAHVAHSQALLMDCISSGVDALTFIGNIVVECKKRDGRRHAVSQLIIVASSLGLLSFFTLQAMSESIQSVRSCFGGHKDEDPEEVNGWITLGFGLGNMFFDIICLFNFYKTNKQTGSGKHANMFSAFLHLGADFLRAITTLVMSLLILMTTWDSTCLDAICSSVIGVTILAGVGLGITKWLRLLLSLCR